MSIFLRYISLFDVHRKLLLLAIGFHYQFKSFTLALFYVFRSNTRMELKERYRTIEHFVNAVRAKGRYSFSRDEVRSNLDLAEKALNQALFRYTSKGKIAKVRHGFYAIIPPEFSSTGMLPPSLFIDDMMKSLGRKYYVGLFSAAAWHGAAHQQPMSFYVVTEKPALRNIINAKLSLKFYVKKTWRDDNIVEKKTDAGYVKVSSPELTAFDLLTYDFSINRVFTILEELAEEMSPTELARIASNFPTTSSIQRLGYMLYKEINDHELAKALKSVMKDRNLAPIPLLKGDKGKGELDSDWKIIKNTELESDL